MNAIPDYRAICKTPIQPGSHPQMSVLQGVEQRAFNQYGDLFSKSKNIRSKISHSISESFVLIQVSFVVALFAIGFFPVYYSQRADDKDMAYAVARGAGSALKLLLPSIFLPTLRMIHAKTYQHLPRLINTSVIGRLFHNRMSLHKFLGEAFLTTAVVHTAAHIYRHSVPLSAQEAVTGTIMLALTILPIVSMYLLFSSRISLANWAFDKSYYKQFLLPHQMGWWGLATAYAVHTRDLRLLSSTIGFFGLFCVDRIWEWAESRNVTVKSINRIHQGMIVLEMEKPQHFVYKTGQKAYLAYPPTTAFINNLHPFTIASSPDEEILRFVISATGEWTRGLVDGLKEGDTVRISPAFPSPLDSKKIDSDRLLITSGSGIAMTLAHLHDRDDKSKISIIHITRNREEFAFLNEYVRNKAFKIISAEYFDTSNGPKSILRSNNEPHNASTNAGRFIPEQHQMFNGFDGRVYFCGNESLGDAVEKEVSKRVNRVFFREKFNF